MTDLDIARHLAESGVPLFLARPTKNKAGFLFPPGWEKTVADPGVVDRWKPGMALCAVTGHVVDVIDVDPRNGGLIEDLEAALGGELPRVYGVQNTPSGGKHYLIATLDVRKVQSVVPGIDIQAGNEEGLGRGFVFLAPTERESKVTGERVCYTWEVDPDLDELFLLGGDDTGAALAELVDAAHARSRGRVNADGSYEGPLYEELSPDHRAEADEVCRGYIEAWRRTLADAVSWPDGHRDDRGRGWETLAYQSAWALAKMAACPWIGMDEDEARVAYLDLLPPELADDEVCAGKWDDRLVDKARGETVDVPPWVARGDVEDDFGPAERKRPICNASNDAHVSDWLDREMGRGGLSGMFRRGEDLIFTPRVGEEGYIPPKNTLDHDGPAQVRRMTATRLANRIDAAYHVVKYQKSGKMVDIIFPGHLADRALSDLSLFPHVQDLRMVSHTPVVRADGTVLAEPGFDAESGVLYLPENGLVVDPVPAEPTEDDVAAARKLLLSMIQDFPFVTDHDRANYLGCLMVPLIRALVPPPYKMLIIGAPQRGSGKSLLALVMRMIHGGVFRSEIPREEDEKRKVITSILDSTSAPVVQFDNVSGALRSSVLDGLLTSAVWTDRRLGVQVNVELANDRLWIATGNNIHIGGDMERRVLWCTINANLEKPELRPADSFGIPHLEEWVRVHRGDLIRAMLVLVRAWAVAGMPTQVAPTSDSFGRMTAVLQGVLAHAGVDGVVDHGSSRPERSDPEAEEWARFLRSAADAMGENVWWTARELLDRVSEFEDGGMPGDDLPGDLADKLRHSGAGAVKSLGKLMSYRNGQWSGGLKIEGKSGGGLAMKWRVVSS